MNVSIVVAPRERFSSLVQTVEELVETVPGNVPIVVVEGGSPPWVRKKIEAISKIRKITWFSLDEPLTPNAARNIGLENTSTKYVVFVDNDITFEEKWLENLVARAETDSADVVAPLICIGPPRARIIHHAGGVLEIQGSGPEMVIKENHRLMDVPIEDFNDSNAPPENQVGEFHCLLVSRSLMDKIGPLDERLITREQMDFALRCMAVNATVRFERNSVVTYSAKVKFTREDLKYHLFRWADLLAVQSIEAFEDSWGVKLDRNRIRFKWIAKHRRNAFRSCFSIQQRVFGVFIGRTLGREESSVRELVASATKNHKIPQKPASTAEQLLIKS